VIYRFGDFSVDPASFRVTEKGDAIALSPKIVDLLLYLVARPGQLVSKDELFKALWPDVAVTDNALTQAVSELRQALHDDPGSPVCIQTVARRGYRFIAPIQHGEPSAQPEADARTAATTVAVLDFTNVSGDRDLAWLSSGIAETVTIDLRASSGWRVIDRVRVVEAVRRTGPDLSTLAADLHLDRAVVGSFQRAGSKLRIVARIVEARIGETLAEARADGPIDQGFELQDRIAAQFAGALGREAGDAVRRRSGGETSSLTAYQAFTEGRIKLESLDADLVPGAIADFERALELDPRYAPTYVGLANARFWEFERSRAGNRPEIPLLARAIDHARRAIELQREFAEAYATLSFLLVAARRPGDALTAARRAVALEPGYWAHQFRLAHAAWGDERLQALARSMELYPDFPFAHFESAMVHIARNSLDRAETVLREGAVVQDRQSDHRQRYPASGLHWLLGLVRLARGDVAEAEGEFARELASGRRHLYAAEFAMNAYDGAGFAALATERAQGAVGHFERALDLFPEHARSLIGLAAAQQRVNKGESEKTWRRVNEAIESLRRGGRGSEAAFAEALRLSATGEHEAAVHALHELLDRADLPFTGWTIPVEPLFEPLRSIRGYGHLLDRLESAAR